MTSKRRTAFRPSQEHSVPWFWPWAAAIEMEKEGLRIFQDNLAFVAEAEKPTARSRPRWASKNRIVLDLDTMRLRDFTHDSTSRTTVPALIDAPYAGHDASIADYAGGQSLVETLKAVLGRVLVTDWKSATDTMKDFDIDKYLAAAIEHVARVTPRRGIWP